MLDDFSSMFSVLMFKSFLQNVSVTTVWVQRKSTLKEHMQAEPHSVALREDLAYLVG